MAKVTETPLMKQYEEMKKKHPDAILLFRVGDFYETFKDDAITLSEICGVTLTRRASGASGEKIDLAGFPHHALDTYLPKLVQAGKRVAICEQLEDPKTSDKTVKRGEPTTEPTTTAKTKRQAKPQETKIYGMSGIEFDKLTPENIIASFRVRIPEDCKPMGKCADKKNFREVFNHVFIQPSTGKLLSSNRLVMTIADVACNGEWPQDKEVVVNNMSTLTQYVAPISGDALSKYAGQEIDVVTYLQDGRVTTLASSETVTTVISSIQMSANTTYPDWKRVWFKDELCIERIKLTDDALKMLRGWFKLNQIKKDWRVEINVGKQADNVQFTLWKEAERDKWEQIDDLRCNIASGYPTHEIHMVFQANLFQLCCLDGFNGEIWFTDHERPIKFCGDQRESILMPKINERSKFAE